ncbi:hypothetical protein GE21DRAFT_6794, partial [Neurospora crassa]
MPAPTPDPPRDNGREKSRIDDASASTACKEDARPSLWSWTKLDDTTAVGPRIGPVLQSVATASSDSDDSIASPERQRELEKGNAIQYRTCSWQKTAALLFSEYICLAIMSFPWSYSVLGLVPGLILTLVVCLVVLYTSLVLWEFCLRHPEVRDVCDIGQMLFWNKNWAWWATAVMFLLNNTFIQGLHVVVGAEYLNTMTGTHPGIACRTVSFGIIIALVCWLCSLPRTFNTLSKLGVFSALFTFISVVLAAAFSGAQKHPAGYDPRPSFTSDSGVASVGGNPIVTALPVKSASYIACFNAFLNISYTFIGQITLPSFIAEMREPKDFPKALWACAIAEFILFSVVGGVIYGYTGNQYMTAPAFGSLQETYKKISFSFMIPTIIFLGVLYASVSTRFIFFRIFKNSQHMTEHTLTGWSTWAGILLTTWICAWIIAEVIPFFSSLLSLMSSLFDSFFGFIFWGVAYFRMRKADARAGITRKRGIGTILLDGTNIIIILVGFLFLSFGSYASVLGILEAYDTGSVRSVFSCASNGL